MDGIYADNLQKTAEMKNVKAARYILQQKFTFRIYVIYVQHFILNNATFGNIYLFVRLFKNDNIFKCIVVIKPKQLLMFAMTNTNN